MLYEVFDLHRFLVFALHGSLCDSVILMLDPGLLNPRQDPVKYQKFQTKLVYNCFMFACGNLH